LISFHIGIFIGECGMEERIYFLFFYISAIGFQGLENTTNILKMEYTVALVVAHHCTNLQPNLIRAVGGLLFMKVFLELSKGLYVLSLLMITVQID
jgi:hypothetical protein